MSGIGAIFAITAGAIYPVQYIVAGSVASSLVTFEKSLKNTTTLNFTLNSKWYIC